MEPTIAKPPLLNRLWRSLVRVIISLLVFMLIVAFYLAVSPNALETVVMWFDPPGVANIPDFGPRPAPPQIDAPTASPPDGTLALNGILEGGSFACGFLLQLDDGQRVGVSSAHAVAFLPASIEAAFLASDGTLAATLTGQVERGSPFRQTHFSSDYALWRVGEISPGISFLKPDPRVLVQPGELVWIYDPFQSSPDGAVRHAGVVMQADAEAIWVQLDESFNPSGFSGCPLVSQHTGRVIGMAVAGEDLPPVLIGAHPVASLVETALQAFK